uniref:Uncharacterized protein n=1 Tax=Knipowitschia caucasica TaxID=637954 RepID=A0AAV2L8S1_KNICA
MVSLPHSVAALNLHLSPVHQEASQGHPINGTPQFHLQNQSQRMCCHCTHRGRCAGSGPRRRQMATEPDAGSAHSRPHLFTFIRAAGYFQPWINHTQRSLIDRGQSDARPFEDAARGPQGGAPATQLLQKQRPSHRPVHAFGLCESEECESETRSARLRNATATPPSELKTPPSELRTPPSELRTPP